MGRHASHQSTLTHASACTSQGVGPLMLPILTPQESAALDAASREQGVTVETLMENAGRAVALAATGVAEGAYGMRAVVLCGTPNDVAETLSLAVRAA